MQPLNSQTLAMVRLQRVVNDLQIIQKLIRLQIGVVRRHGMTGSLTTR